MYTPIGNPAPVPDLKDDYKIELYKTYFEKDFPDVDPLVLANQQWHQEAPDVNQWLELVRSEFTVLSRWLNSPLVIDHEFKIARAKWNEYYDG
jgi:hypothetical protein